MALALQAPIRWGCVGTGQIAMAMAQQLARLPEARKEVLCSASGKPAATIEAERLKYGYARAATLEELVCDPEVDVVYVASANTGHAAHCLAALRGGKHVLCEKPLAMTAAEAEEVFAEAERRGLLLVDGTFSACLPGFEVIRTALPTLGEIRHVELNKKIKLSIMNSSPIINLRSMGGGLFDGCGSYTAHALCVIFGATTVAALRPEDVDVASTAGGPTGEVDWDTTVTLRMGLGATAVLTHRAANEGKPSVVRGDQGTIEFDLPRLQNCSVNGQQVDVSYSGSPSAVDLPEGEQGAPYGVHVGLGMEAAAVHRELLAASEGPRGPGTAALPLEAMRAMAHVMDLVRQRIPTHLHYASHAVVE